MFEWGKCWTVNQNWVDRNISSFQKDVCLTEIRYCNSTDLAPCLCFAACKWVFSFLSSSAVKPTMKSQKYIEEFSEMTTVLLSNTRNWCLISKAASKGPLFQTHCQWKHKQWIPLKTVLKGAHYQRWLMIQANGRQLFKKNILLLLIWGAQEHVFMVRRVTPSSEWALVRHLKTRMSQPTLRSALPHADPCKPELFWYWDFIANWNWTTWGCSSAVHQLSIFKLSGRVKAVFLLGFPVWKSNK